jgi:hypothetical protein
MKLVVKAHKRWRKKSKQEAFRNGWLGPVGRGKYVLFFMEAWECKEGLASPILLFAISVSNKFPV